ncbi:MAG: magnesium transporter [Pseudomonadota bacterium]|nr:magnesium transporter [Pseudomonadota bacterium]MEC8797156.1 magnesium transporter [Pseudomonadota bacterium]|tara:strand:- start:675 stop:2051 length:1377 start_codon:yes stop_codon:yes gene_type:complete
MSDHKLDDKNRDFIPFDPSIISEIMDALDLSEKQKVIAITKDLSAADIADIINLLPRSEIKSFIEFIENDFNPEILSELEEHIREEVINFLGPTHVAEFLQKLETDDAVHVIEDLDENDKNIILNKIPDIERKDLELSLNYPEDSAGRLMSVDFVSLSPNMNVGEAIDSFRISDDLPIEFYEIYLVNDSSKPIAAISLSNIIRSSRDKSLKDLESHELIMISADMDRELVAYQFERFDLVSAPVVDDKGSLIGVITADDIVEVFKDEAGEDIKLLGGVGDEDITDSVIETSSNRFSWLFVNLITAVIASIVIGFFGRTIEEIVALAILMPIVASMGGNAGTQTLTITVRSLSTRDLIPLNYKRIINREILVSLLNGLLFAIIIGVLSAMWFSNFGLGLVLAIAMVINMVTAGFAGIIIPLILNKLGIDPALASSVFVTTVTDVVGFMVFLGLAALYLV